MANRTETVTLTAQVSNYLAGLDAAQKKTAEFGDRSAEKFEATNRALGTVGTGLLAIGAVAAAGVAVAVAKYAEFDQAMSQVKAQTQETTANMDLLRDAALDAGGRTIFTATEAANAIEEIGKAGLTTKDILTGGLNGALDLAASSQLDVARAAEISATTLKQFGLAGDQAGRVADVLSAGAGKALGSVEDLANAMQYVGPVAAGMGISLEDTAAALSLFADQGILGEQAGTSLRGVLASLTSPSKQAADEIQRLGINLYDSQGQFLGLENVAGQLSKAYDGATDAQKDFSLGVIFGNAQVTSARVLVGQGADSFRKYRDAVDETGFASRVARDRLDNLRGDVEKLGGAFDTAFIKTGSGANDSLRSLVQTATFLVDAIGNAPQPVLNTGLAIGSVAAAVALTGGAILTAIPKVAELKTAFTTLGTTARTTALAAGGITLALTAVVVVLGAVASAQAEARAKAEAYADTLEDGTNRVTKATRDLAKEALSAKQNFLGFDVGKSAFDAAESLGISLDKVTDAASGNVKALEELQAKQKEFTDSDYENTSEREANINRIVSVVKGESSSIEEAIRIAKQKQQADQESAEGSETAAGGYLAAADAAGQLSDELNQVVEEILKLNGIGQDAVSTNIAFLDALAKVDEQITNVKAGTEGYGAGLDLSTEAGRRNTEVLNDLAEKSQAAARAQFDLDGNTTAFQSRLESGRQALVDRAIQLGASADEANRLGDEIYKIPTTKELKVIADTKDATDKISGLRAALNTIDLNPVIRFSTTGGAAPSVARASGGIIPGAPSATDNVYLHAASGEFITNSAATAKNRGVLEYINRGGVIRGYADGGYVSDRPVYRVVDNSRNDSSRTVANDIKITAPQIADPYVLGTVLGRELRRRL